MLRNLDKQTRLRILGHAAVPFVKMIFDTPFAVESWLREIEHITSPIPASMVTWQTLKSMQLTLITLLLIRIHSSEIVKQVFVRVCCCTCGSLLAVRMCCCQCEHGDFENLLLSEDSLQLSGRVSPFKYCVHFPLISQTNSIKNGSIT